MNENPYQAPAAVSPVSAQVSVSVIVAAIIVLSGGLALLYAAPWLSMFSLIGMFLVAASPGMVVGYARRRWRGGIVGGCLSGTLLIVSLMVIGTIAAALLP